MTDITRKKHLACIHAAKKKAGLDEADYRAVLRQVVGKESAGACDLAELAKLAAHFKSFNRPPAAQGGDYYHVPAGYPFLPPKAAYSGPLARLRL